MASGTDSGALFDAIEDRAGEERARIRAEAEARAGQIGASADAEIERLKAAAMRALEKELAAERQRLLGEARMRARIGRLETKRRFLAEAFKLAGERIARLAAGEGNRAALEGLAAEAKAEVGEPCVVEVRAEDGTVTARSPDGRRSADNSPATRLGRAQAGAEPQVAQLLFGKRKEISP